MPTRLAHAASPGLCITACDTSTANLGAPAYALLLSAGELLEITVSGLDAFHAGVWSEPQPAAVVAATIRRVLATQRWPDSVMFMYVTALEAMTEQRPVLLSTNQVWELDRSSSWPTTAAGANRDFQSWPAHENVNFRVLSSLASEEVRDLRDQEAKLRSDPPSAVDGAVRAHWLYRMGRAQELLGMSKAASETFDSLIDLRGNGAIDEHMHHAYLATGRTRAARGRLEQGILRFLAAYELLPERGVEPLVEAAVACRNSGRAPNLARHFAFAAVAENQGRNEDGRQVPSRAHAAVYDYAADVEALVVVSNAGEAALSVIRKSLGAASRLLRNSAAPRFLWLVWKYNAVTILDRLKLRDDVIMVQAQIDDVAEALVSAAPICEVDEVLLGAAERQHGCPAFAGLLSQTLIIIDSSSQSTQAAQLAISFGCDSYIRVRVPVRMMHAELNAEPATSVSGQQARTTFAHLCAVAHVESVLPNETLQVLIMQDNVPPPSPADVSYIVENLAEVLHNGHSASDARLTLLGGDTLETSLHAYALSLTGAQLIARSLTTHLEETGLLLQSRFHELIHPLVQTKQLLVNAAAGSPLSFAAEVRNQLNTQARPGKTKAADLVVACMSYDEHDALVSVREQHWLIPLLLRNATGLRVRLVQEDEASNAHAILLLYSQHNHTKALALAGELCSTVPLVIVLEHGQRGIIDVCSRSVLRNQRINATISFPSMPRWLQAALVLRSFGSWLDGINFHPGLIDRQQFDVWSRKPAHEALWYDTNSENRARTFLSAMGLATHSIAGPDAGHLPVPLKQQGVRLVVSLTSIPPRVRFLPRVVASLLNQTHVPDVIYVILPQVWARGNASEWMPAVEQMARHIERLDPRVVVQRPLVDLGPVMKLLPALLSEDSHVDKNVSGANTRTLLLYLDDDWILPPGFVHAFVAAEARNPGKLFFRSCGDELYEVARRDEYTRWLGCSLPEAFAGVLLPLTALRADLTQGVVTVKDIHQIVSVVAAHPVCLRSDDFVLGELFTRLHIRNERLPADLETNLGGMPLRLMDTVYALDGGCDDIVPTRYTACAKHLRAALDALLPDTILPISISRKPALQPRTLPISRFPTTLQMFAEYRYAVVGNLEQAVQAFSVGTIPLMLNCDWRDHDLVFARALLFNRVLCIGSPRGIVMLDRLMRNASVQQAFFAQPVAIQGGLSLIHSRLANAANMLHAQLCASRLGANSRTTTIACAESSKSGRSLTRSMADADDAETTRAFNLTAVAEPGFMRGKAFSLWNFKPNETSPFPTLFNANLKFLPPVHSIVGPEDVQSCMDEFPGLLSIWNRISPWIVRSDLARLLYVYSHGGFYLDSDCEIFTELPVTSDPVVLFVESIVPPSFLGPREMKAPERRLRIANYAFGSSVTRHAFFRECVEECMRRLDILEYAAKSHEDVMWGCGPDVITSVYHAKNHSINLLGRGYVTHRAAGSWRS